MDAETEQQNKVSEETAAMENIRNQLGVACVTFAYTPEEMEYQEFKLMDDSLGAIVFYNYGGKSFTVIMQSGEDDIVGYYSVDSDAVLQAKVKSEQNIEVEIWEINLNEEEEAYAAKFQFNKCKYMLNGKLPLEEMKNIVKYMVLL